MIDLGIQPLWLPSGIITEVMKRDGILREQLRREGMTIRFHPFLKGADVNEEIHGHALEGGVGGDMPTITACVTDQVRVVSLVDLYFTAIVAREAMLLSGLRGRRIGYAFGSNAHHALLTALAGVELSESEVTLVPMEAHAMPLALEQGTIEAFSVWEPIPTLATQRYGHKVVHRFLSSGYLYFSRSFAEGHAEQVAWLVSAEARALNWLELSDDNLERAVGWWEVAARETGGQEFAISRQEATRLARRSLRHLWIMPVIPMDDLSENGRIGRATRFLGGIGKVPSQIDWKTIRACFQREVGERVLAAPLENRLNEFVYEEQPE
ncbi:MAG: ABC transporter substrate-binding protein [Magnetococcales bacterium]|nr:ABC transporter substrate-binding protein [Magnetococcales bacterium]